jgi:hypothetical protein
MTTSVAKLNPKNNIRPLIRPHMSCVKCNCLIKLEWSIKSEMCWQHEDPLSTCDGGNSASVFARRYLFFLLKDNYAFNIRGECNNCKIEWRKTIPYLVAKRTLPLPKQEIKVEAQETTHNLHMKERIGKNKNPSVPAPAPEKFILTSISKLPSTPTLGLERKTSGEVLDYKEEYEYKASDGKIHTLDIAAFNPVGELVFAVKLCTTKKETPTLFEEFPHYGILAEDLLDKFDRITPIKNHTFLDTRSGQPCSTNCLPMREIALSLGYLVWDKSYPCEAVCILEKACSGFYFPDIDIWNLDGHKLIIETEFIKAIWDKFLTLSRCIRCNIRDSSIAYKRPYCVKCYDKLHGGEKFQAEKIFISDAERKELKKSLAWIDKIPKKINNKDPCFFCNRSYLSRKENEGLEMFWGFKTGYVANHIVWFNGKKSCCSVCLDDQFRKRGLIK